jgi:radical SAM superfamily enzyme YgiQ (UPF0313 family)
MLVSNHGVSNIKFADELFVLDEEHVNGICDLLIERGYDLNIWAYARVDRVRKPDLLEKLRNAGVRWLALGIESGSERVLSDVAKKTHLKDITEAVSRIHSAGIYVIGNYIFGLPEDDKDSMQQTLDFAKALKCEFANFYCAMAYPGSRLYDLALAKLWALPAEWSGYSQLSVDTLALPTNYVSGEEVLRSRDAAFRAYFSDPDYQRRIQNVFGEGALEEIRAMLATDIKRRCDE